ncbi:MAG: helix-turn-helix domain-containing protein [Pseudoalteromonas prydzensis]|uniref:helix-turn-helix domain-containing protein n=1 Tax=Pseudoalteromonas prydzensis TaxID=182141 RepID=UPI003F9A9AAF
MSLYDGQLLASARKKMSLTQEQASEIIGLGRRQISQMENGVFDGGIKYFIQYLKLLNLKIDIISSTGDIWRDTSILQDSIFKDEDTCSTCISEAEREVLNRKIDELFLNNQ